MYLPAFFRKRAKKTVMPKHSSGIKRHITRTRVNKLWIELRWMYCILDVPTWCGGRWLKKAAKVGQQKAELTCRVCSIPDVRDYAWTYRDGTPLRDGISGVTSRTITIDTVQMSDLTHYRCTTTSEIGNEEVQRYFDIELQEKGK